MGSIYIEVLFKGSLELFDYIETIFENSPSEYQIL